MILIRCMYQAENVNEQLYAANVTHLDGLFPTAWNLKTGEPATRSSTFFILFICSMVTFYYPLERVSIGATADSGYEYLLKQWLLTNQTEEKTLEMCAYRIQFIVISIFKIKYCKIIDLKTADKVIENLLYLSPIRNLLYVTDVQFWKQAVYTQPKIDESMDDSYSELDDDDIFPHEPEPAPVKTFILSRTPSRKFEHLSCFLPGLLALGTHRIPEKLLSQETREIHLLAAQGLGNACWMMYADQPSGLGPDEVTFFSAYDIRAQEIAKEKEAEAVKLKAEAEAKAKVLEAAQAEEDDDDEDDSSVVDHLEKRIPVSQAHVVNQTAFDESHRWSMAYEEWVASGRIGALPGLTSAEISPPNSKTRDYRANNSGYFLRPETVESFYILWRATGDIIWRERGWKVFEALLESAQTANGAFASIKNVQRSPTDLKNEMPRYVPSYLL